MCWPGKYWRRARRDVRGMRMEMSGLPGSWVMVAKTEVEEIFR